jgi:hypothetical protein
VRVLIFAAFILLASCGGGDSRKTPGSVETKAPSTPSVKITQFYASKPGIPKGESSLLCYGVEGAAKVRLEPPVAQLSPALTRCFEVKPDQSTVYTLIAEGRDGTSVKQTASVQVGGARPRLFDLSINKEKVRPGEEIQFCFQAQNATSVRGSHGKFLRGGIANKDCLVDSPSKTTTYTITVSNAQQLTDSASMTVEVRP